MMSDTSTPEAQKAAVGKALAVGTAAGVLSYATGLSGKIANAVDGDPASNFLQGDAITTETLGDGKIKTFYQNGYTITDPTTGVTSIYDSLGALLNTSAASTAGANSSVMPAINTSEILPYVAGAAVGASIFSDIPIWVWLLGGFILITN
jgi:hypothetical protein